MTEKVRDSQPDIVRKECATCERDFVPEPDLVYCPHDGTLLAATFADNLIGSVIADRYKVTELLGEGGYSRVYKAEHQAMRRTVAIKILRSELCPDAATVKRFQIEAQAAASLKHPNIAAVYDYGMLPDGHPYIAMEYVDGMTLQAMVAYRGPIPEDLVVKLFAQACDALSSAHTAGILHRDLKPGNLIVSNVDGSYTLRLVDFGLAKLTDAAEQSQLTMSGQTLGTPVFMSPEQCLGHQLDERSDVYSLALALYFAVTGAEPVTAQSNLEAMHRQVYEYPALPSRTMPQLAISEALESAIFKAIDKEPECRFQTMEEFKSALLEGSAPKWSGRLVTTPQVAGNPLRNRMLMRGALRAVSILVTCLLLGVASTVAINMLQSKTSSGAPGGADRVAVAQTVVDLSARKVTPEMLEAADPRATDLNLSETWFNAGTLRAITRFKNVRKLDLTNVAIEAEDVANIAALPKLEDLSLQKTSVGYLKAPLDKLPESLVTLSLKMTDVADEQLAGLTHLPNLRNLDLSMSGIAGTDFSPLSRIPKLTELNLSYTDVNDNALASLSSIPRLTSLDLSETALTGVKLAELAKMTSLRSLDLRDCKHLDKNAARQLQQLMPNCRVYF